MSISNAHRFLPASRSESLYDAGGSCATDFVIFTDRKAKLHFAYQRLLRTRFGMRLIRRLADLIKNRARGCGGNPLFLGQQSHTLHTGLPSGIDHRNVAEINIGIRVQMRFVPLAN
jgi:hypothetical protein